MDYSISLLAADPGEDLVGPISSVVDFSGNIWEMGFDMVSSIGAFILSNPLLLCAVVLPLVGLGIGIFKRLLNN